MKLQIGIPSTSQNLAGALDGDEGLFLCQHSGQNYLVEAAQGHSIVSGPTPVGARIQQSPQITTAAEPWTITKISEKPIGFLQSERDQTRRGEQQRG